MKKNGSVKAELLAPSGNFDCVKAAVNAGADAVYLGGRAFGARAYAANFDNAELEQVCDFCHSYGVKVYVTVNTLYKDSEFSELITFIEALYAMGVDGLIMQDLGAIRLVREHFPELPVHASTQLTANSLDDVKEFESLGLKTVVLSRELNLQEIQHIVSNTSVRIETFIHGALCVSYSGQCLMSSVLGNRSGNRGKCAQNCRLSYELTQDKQLLASGHLLSTKDICTLTLLPELLKTGVASLKIEGRMKSPEYVAGVTAIYRKYMDLYYSGETYHVDRKDILTLQQLFNRGAFSEGYLQTHSGMKMMCPTHPKHWGVYAGKVLSYDRKNQQAVIRFEKKMVPGDGIEIRTEDEEGSGTYLNKAAAAGQKTVLPVRGEIREQQAVYQTYDKRLMDELKLHYEKITRKVPLEAAVTLHAGKPSELTVCANGQSVTIRGDVPTAAQNQPLTAESVSAQIAKLGNTIFTAEKIDADVEDGLYLNKSSLNSLKNYSIDVLQKQIIESYKRSLPKDKTTGNLKENISEKRTLSVNISKPDQFEVVLRSPAVSVIYLEMTEPLMMNLKETFTKVHASGKKIFVRLPRIWREYVQDDMPVMMQQCRESDIDGFLISCIGHYHAVKDSGKSFALDFTGNVMNSRTYSFWQDLGAESVALSVEMSRDEINALPDRSRTEILAYGYIPLMVTHQCPIGNFAGRKQNAIHCNKCGHTEEYTLRSGKDTFRLETDCRNCISTITTARPIDIRDDLSSFNVKTFRLNFTDESTKEISKILKKFEENLMSKKIVKNQRQSIYDKSVL